MDSVFPSSILVYKIYKARKYHTPFNTTIAGDLAEEISAAMVTAMRNIVHRNKEDRILLNAKDDNETPNMLFSTMVTRCLNIGGDNLEDEIVRHAFTGFKLYVAEEQRREGHPVRINAEHTIEVDQFQCLIITRHEAVRSSPFRPYQDDRAAA